MKRSLIAFATVALSTAALSAFAQISTDTLPVTTTTKPWIPAHKSDLEVSLGLNTFAGKNAQTTNGYELRPLGSRFVSLGAMHRFRILSGPKTALALKTGLEVSWNNFMLEGNRVISTTGGHVAFTDSDVPLAKSKLTVAYLNIPVMPTVVFRKGAVSHISLGGYAGMRLDSYTKTKTQSGSKDRDHGRYFVNNFRYGVGMSVGFRCVGTVFAEYDLNKVFEAGKGPQVSAVNFGIRL